MKLSGTQQSESRGSNLDRLDAARPTVIFGVSDGERNDLHTLARQVKRAFASKDWGLALKVLKEEGVTPERCQWAAMIERRFTGRDGNHPQDGRRGAAQACQSTAGARSVGVRLFLESPGGRARSRGVPGAGLSDRARCTEVGGAFVTKLHMRYSGRHHAAGRSLGTKLDRKQLSRPTLVLDASYNRADRRADSFPVSPSPRS